MNFTQAACHTLTAIGERRDEGETRVRHHDRRRVFRFGRCRRRAFRRIDQIKCHQEPSNSSTARRATDSSCSILVAGCVRARHPTPRKRNLDARTRRPRRVSANQRAASRTRPRGFAARTQSRCLRVLGVGFMVLGFTLLGVVLVVTARELELRKRGHV